MTSFTANVNPQLLVWARKTASYDIVVAAKKIGVKAEKLKSWEEGKTSPTVSQLRNISNTYKRALAIFYLPEIPKTFKPLTDYRRMRLSEIESPTLQFEIRNAEWRRESALSLYEDLKEEPQKFNLKISTTEDFSSITKKLREVLNIKIEEQIKWEAPRVALNNWKNAVENLGILVFQASGINPKEMRAFSISKNQLPVIVLNSGDSYNGRIFSLIHELAHLCLGNGGICDLHESQKIEAFCNLVAGSVLVPEENLINETIVIKKLATNEIEWTDEEIATLANKYKVSGETILRRILFVGATSESFYKSARVEFEKKYELYKSKRKSKKIIVPPSTKAIARSGHLFSSLAMESYTNRLISLSDVSELFQVKIKHLPLIEQKLSDYAQKYGGVYAI